MGLQPTLIEANYPHTNALEISDFCPQSEGAPKLHSTPKGGDRSLDAIRWHETCIIYGMAYYLRGSGVALNLQYGGAGMVLASDAAARFLQEWAHTH